MGFIPHVGMQGPQPIQPRGEQRATLPAEVMSILRDIGIHTIRTVRIQHGAQIPNSLKEMAQLTLTHDQKNALQGLGVHGLLVAMFADDEDINANYKQKLEDLHEQLLGEEQVKLLKEAFGLSQTPFLLEDDNKHGILFLQDGIKDLEDALQS